VGIDGDVAGPRAERHTGAFPATKWVGGDGWEWVRSAIHALAVAGGARATRGRRYDEAGRRWFWASRIFAD
jgi:hypothetical protein